MNVELPKDADGREIPLDTKVLYDNEGKRRRVDWYTFYPGKDKWDVIFADSCVLFSPRNLSLTPPDSWEKLLDDLDRALSTPGPDTYASITCGYFDSANVNCSVCEYMHGIKNETCNDDAWRDIASRIRNLRSADE